MSDDYIKRLQEQDDIFKFEQDHLQKHLWKIDIQDKYHIKILFEETDIEMEQALGKTLKYFETEEEYEKCAVLKKYLDFLNLSS